MAEIHVRQGAAGAGGSVPTLAAAGALVKAGDTVVIHEGVYAALAAPVDTHWKASEGEAVTIDGGWKGKRMADDSGPPAVSLKAGATLEGVTIRNSLGSGVVLNDNAALINCRVERSYGNGVTLWKVKAARVEKCVISEACIRFTVGGHQGGASVAIVDSEDCVVTGNTICYGYGEGVDVGRGSKRIRVWGNIIFDHQHVHLYFVRSQESVAEGNIVFHTGHERFLTRNGRVPGGIVFGDENTEKMRTFPPMRANVVRGNLVVNMGGCLAARNNDPDTHKDDSPYDTSLDADTVIEGNTFVAGPMTDDAVLIVPNYQGRPHGPARFRRNVVIGPATAPTAFRYEANAWQPLPAASLRSGSDVAAELVNAAASGKLANQYPAVGHNLSLDDYRPRPGSVIALGNIGALGPEGPEPPVEPPPPPPPDPEPEPLDRAALLERVAAAAEQLAVIHMATEAAIDEVAALLGMLAEEPAA